MNMLRRTSVRQFFRFVETSSSAPPPPSPPQTKFFAERLSNRALVRVQGEDVVPLLQGLITNDMNHLYKEKNAAMFTMFLNNTGRVLYDAIIYRTPGEDTFLIECDRDLSPELRRHLRLYRVRRKIDIECINSDYSPWVVYNPEVRGELPMPSEAEMKTRSTEVLYTPDPRVRDLGARLVLPQGSNLKDLGKLFTNGSVEQPTESEYSKHRYIYGVGEGVNDHPPGKCFPLEANCDFLHGVSFQKGCYIGQELTARVYHTGVIRKRLMPLKLSSELEPNITAVQTQAGAVVGNIRGASHRRALALLRVEQVLNAQELMIDGDPCNTYKPHWWPKELPKSEMKEQSPQPGPSSSAAPSGSPLLDEFDMKTEKEEIDRLQLPDEVKEPPPPAAEEDDRIPRISFHCESCGMNEMVHYKGAEPQFVFGVKLLEDSYVMRDPFQPHPPRWRRKPEFFIILGAHCCLCDKVVCRDAECSFYYASTFCLNCAKEAVKSFPLEVQTKLRKQLANVQRD